MTVREGYLLGKLAEKRESWVSSRLSNTSGKLLQVEKPPGWSVALLLHRRVLLIARK